MASGCNGALSGQISNRISMTVFPLRTSEVFRGFVELVLLLSRRLASLIFPFHKRFPNLVAVDTLEVVYLWKVFVVMLLLLHSFVLFLSFPRALVFFSGTLCPLSA